jgi:subtilase family serine protease
VTTVRIVPTRHISRHRPHSAPPPRRQTRPWLWLAAAFISGCLTAACTTAASTTGTAAPAATTPLNCAKPGYRACYSPQQYQVAYGVAPLLRQGIDGRGETVAIFATAETPSDPGTGDIRKVLAAFDARFGLPQAGLHVVNTFTGSPVPYLAGVEEIGDAEIVHALAPGATLDLILVPEFTSTYANSVAHGAAAFTEAVRESAALHAAVLSISATGGEGVFTRAEVAAMNQALEQARQQHVTVVASSGDGGAVSSYPGGPPVRVSLPASDPLVLSVGGTSLNASWATGTYHGETAWNTGDEASGGGYSTLFPRPAYQDGLARARATRGVPDVAANADTATGMAVLQGDGGLHSSRGTSASAPLWAGVIALADQEAGQHLGFINPAIYAIARSPAYHQAFHDVITGDNSVQWHGSVITGYHAGPGWDPVTGWGSPDAQYLVPLLARTARSGA